MGASAHGAIRAARAWRRHGGERAPVGSRVLLLLLLTAAVAAAACAGTRQRRELAVSLQTADALAARGCHACLVDALAIYDRLTSREPRTTALLDRRRFRTTLLLALREKELGLTAIDYLARARALAAGGSADVDRVAFAELVPHLASGLPREAQMLQLQRLADARDRVVARLERARGATDDAELDAYIDLALACSGRTFLRPGTRPETLRPADLTSRLLDYRLGTCGPDYEAQARAALDSDARFVDALLFLGRHQLARMRTVTAAEGRATLAHAHAAFPTSPGIAMELADATRATSFREALPLYTRVTEQVPLHQDAWYGKGLCESYLARHPDAIATLTRLLDLGQWLAGDAYYWRAWNRHQLKQLDAAWDDVERAKRLLYNTNVYTLAGVIAYDRQQLDVARVDLEKALGISSRSCTAAWYLGLTHAAGTRWPDAAAAFAAATTCYRADADDARRDLAIAEALDAASPIRAERTAAARATIAESLRQEALSAYNAAYAFVSVRDADRARPWLDLARQHADVKARADELLAFVNRP